MDGTLRRNGNFVSASATDHPEASQVKCCLQGILTSAPFARATRMAKFLAFIVERTLANASSDLKEYVIGLEVFDRDITFDPRLDPIVRVEARRLRIKLKEYYDQHPSKDSIRIEIPPGGYGAKFSFARRCGNDLAITRAQQSKSRSLAVLPLINLGIEVEDDCFASGLTEELLYMLVNLPNIYVAVGHAPNYGKGDAFSARGVVCHGTIDYVLEGSVRREHSAVRVAVHLASTRSGFRVWSQIYQRDLLGSVATQRYFAENIAADLHLELSRIREEFPYRRDFDSSYPLYMAGNSQLNTRTESGIKRSIEYFEQIVERDPIFALAHAGLAEAYSLGGRYHVFPPQESWNRARSAAVNALRIDDSLVEAHTTLAFVELHQHRDWRRAGQGFSKAIALNPLYATARRWYAWCLAAAGCQELALSHIRRALAINPASANANADLAQVLYFSRQYDESISQCGKTVELAPQFHRIYQLLGRLYFQKTDYRTAVEHFQMALRISGGDQRTAVLLAHTFAAMGETDQVHRLLAELTNLRGAYVSAMNFALLYSALGNYDHMFTWLEKAYFEDDGDLIWLPVDPIYDQARKDIRFTAFLDHIAQKTRKPRRHCYEPM